MAITANLKDVGIVAEFVRWGWAYHGKIESGTIGATGKSHTQPYDVQGHPNNVGWLIDMGLPAITLTPSEQAFYDGHNIEWRNYALVAGGYVYGSYLGDETFIHMDASGEAWRIALSYSQPTTDVLRITAAVTPFGRIERWNGTTPPVSPITKTVDVSCTWIHADDPFGAGGEGNYTMWSAKIEDVHTNGGKAIIGVFLRKDPGYGFDIADDLFSVVEITLSGMGGTVGNGLALAGTEIMPYTSLIERNTNPNDDTLPDIYARYAYYNQAGDAKAVRLKIVYYIHSGPTSVHQHMKMEILENSTSIDQFGWEVFTGSTARTAFGALGSYVPAADPSNGIIQSANMGNVLYPWRAVLNVKFSVNLTYTHPASATGVYYFGIHRMPSKAAAFIASNDSGTTGHYGTVATPIGGLSTGMLADPLLNFAYQRKTGDYVFANNAVCYV